MTETYDYPKFRDLTAKTCQVFEFLVLQSNPIFPNFLREILTMMEFLQTSLGAQCVFESCRSH